GDLIRLEFLLACFPRDSSRKLCSRIDLEQVLVTYLAWTDAGTLGPLCFRVMASALGRSVLCVFESWRARRARPLVLLQLSRSRMLRVSTVSDLAEIVRSSCWRMLRNP